MSKIHYTPLAWDFSENTLSLLAQAKLGSPVSLSSMLSLPRPQVPLGDLLQPSVPPDGLDLVCRLLVFNPDKRLTAAQALQHPYVSRYSGNSLLF